MKLGLDISDYGWIEDWHDVDAWIYPGEIDMMGNDWVDEASSALWGVFVQSDAEVRKGALVVVAHGYPYSMWVTDNDGGHGFIDAHTLAQIILNETHWKPDQPIILASCSTGKDNAPPPYPWETDHTTLSFAHQLANELHAKVTALDRNVSMMDFARRGQKNSGWITYDGTK
jgi:hypothetical protein